jgi:hypothetical protein
VNTGGRVHTFTQVAQFGGGKAANPALNKGLVTSPECPSVDVAPGDGIVVSGQRSATTGSCAASIRGCAP